MLRQVVDPCIRANDAVVEGERIDERLQGRARRANAAGEIDEPGRRIASLAADIGPHSAAVDLGDDHGDRRLVALPADHLARHFVDAPLQPAVDRHAHDRLFRPSGRFAPGEMIGRVGHRQALEGQR